MDDRFGARVVYMQLQAGLGNQLFQIAGGLMHSDKVIIKFSENHDNPVLIVGGKEDNRCPR